MGILIETGKQQPAAIAAGCLVVAKDIIMHYSFPGIRFEQFQSLCQLVQTRSPAAAALIALESLDDVVYILAYDGSGRALWVDHASVRKDAFGDDPVNDFYFDPGGAGA